MGISLDIWVKEKELKKLIKDDYGDTFNTLLSISDLSWNAFLDKFKIDDIEMATEPITAEELADHIATLNEYFPEREIWYYILKKFPKLVFAPDTISSKFANKGYINICAFKYTIQEFIIKHLDECINLHKKEK